MVNCNQLKCFEEFKSIEFVKNESNSSISGPSKLRTNEPSGQ